ncbi:hypothetical protein D3C80_1642830 [compost metagenome]
MTEFENDRDARLDAAVVGQADVVHVLHLDHEVVEHLGHGCLRGGDGVVATGGGMKERGVDHHARLHFLADVIADAQLQYVLVEAHGRRPVLGKRQDVSNAQITRDKTALEHF